MTLRLTLRGEAQTARLGHDLAAALRPGDLVTLSGDLGAGKTTLARSLLRALAENEALEVPSPTFTLVQSYPEGRVPAHHCDLYRLADPSEVEELGLSEMLEDGVVLVEWPERADLPGPEIRLALTESEDGEAREVAIDAQDESEARIARSLAIRAFLEASGHGNAARVPVGGDASSRAYEVVEPEEGGVPGEGGEPLLLMDSPAMPDGPPVRGGVPYSRIAHLAENVSPFVAVADALRGAGFAAPAILGADLEAGLLLTEHLGEGSILNPDGSPMPARYRAVARTLAAIHDHRWDQAMPVRGGSVHVVPHFDRGAMMIEVELTLDWAFPRLVGRPADEGERESYHAAWNGALDAIASAETSLVLRDVQAPNVVWREDREGLGRVGLIDFQDALIGPAAYDVASLAQDARVTVAPGLEADLKATYLEARVAASDPQFEAAYCVLAAQRATKVFGLWVRLDERDGKPQYLAHAPRTREYMLRVLGHPALADVRSFFEHYELLERSRALAA